MSIGLLIVNPLLQQYKSLGTCGLFKKVLFPLLKQWKKSPLFKELGFIAIAIITISHCYIVLLAPEILYKK